MDGRSGASPTSRAGEIVVGVDGSPGSLAALCWSIRERNVRGMRVHAVAAWEFPVESTFGDMATVGDFHPVIAAEETLLAARAPRPVVVIRTATTRTSRDLGPDADGNAP